MNPDDVAFPERLEWQYKAARSHPDVVVWGTYMRRITEEGLPMAPIKVGARTHEEFRNLGRSRSLIRCYGTAALFRRDIQLRVGGFDPRFEPMEDSELWD